MSPIWSSILSDMIAGAFVAVFTAVVLRLSRKIVSDREWLWANKLPRLGWPFLTLVLFATALVTAWIRGRSLLILVVLGVLFGLALLFFYLRRRGPAKIRHLLSTPRGNPWQILSGIFFLIISL